MGNKTGGANLFRPLCAQCPPQAVSTISHHEEHEGREGRIAGIAFLRVLRALRGEISSTIANLRS
jgi:hypothetical protein